MAHRKPHLPEKPCATCGRPFAWRKKWARDWENVRHCSDACRSGRRAAALAGSDAVLPGDGARATSRTGARA